MLTTIENQKDIMSTWTIFVANYELIYLFELNQTVPVGSTYNIGILDFAMF